MSSADTLSIGRNWPGSFVIIRKGGQRGSPQRGGGAASGGGGGLVRGEGLAIHLPVPAQFPFRLTPPPPASSVQNKASPRKCRHAVSTLLRLDLSRLVPDRPNRNHKAGNGETARSARDIFSKLPTR